jgi:hypothetical protein
LRRDALGAPRGVDGILLRQLERGFSLREDTQLFLRRQGCESRTPAGIDRGKIGTAAMVQTNRLPDFFSVFCSPAIG